MLKIARALCRWQGPALGCALRMGLLGALLLQGANAWSAPGADTPTIEPIPAWVKPVALEIPSTAPSEKLSRGVYYLLSDRQVKIDAHQRQTFVRSAAQAVNTSGVERVANIAIRFDPSYQTLSLHAISVHRQGQVIPKLSTTAIQVLQREKELDYLIFDGSKTANVFLEDVRVGDVVEFAYTLIGANPVFDGHSFGEFEMQWGVPLHQLFARLVWPTQRPLFIKNLNRTASESARTGELAGHTVYEWSAHALKGLELESDVPNWFDPYPSVQWGDFEDWASVARWAVPLYQVPPQLGHELQVEVDRIRAEFAAPADRLVQSLRFVQKNIRYLGVEVGAGSHAPTPPALVMARRFGDCKDKTLLTLSLLQALGIEAHAALVNTQTTRGVLNQNPSPRAFNHVLVRATLNGVEYWLDPTRDPQLGPLDSISQARFGAALVIDPSTLALQAMPDGPATLYSRRVLSTFDAQAGFDQPVAYTVTSLLDGVSAEQMRRALANESVDTLQSRYLNFFARYYPGITVQRPFDVNDNHELNQITLTEHYTIADFWLKDAAQERLHAQIEFPELLGYFRTPESVVRKQPMALSHPVDIVYTTLVLLPKPFNIKPEFTEVLDPSFAFSSRLTTSERAFTFSNRFRTLVDQLEAAEVPRYAAKQKQVRAALGYQLSSPVPGTPATPGQ